MYDIPTPSLAGQVSAAEWQTRVELAAAYRLMVMHGWDDLIHTHISARIPDTEYLLINAFGLAFEEVTASNLVKIDIQGNVSIQIVPLVLILLALPFIARFISHDMPTNAPFMSITRMRLRWHPYKMDYVPTRNTPPLPWHRWPIMTMRDWL